MKTIEFGKDENKTTEGRLTRVPTKYYPAMKRFIEENVKAGRLRPSSSSTSSGTFMTPKSDPTVDPRLVHDYRALNENTIKDHTPLPRQDAILERMVRAFIRGKMDLKDAFYQIRIREGDIYKTAIKTPFGLFEWVVMPQGLCNAPATFQRYMNFILREYIGEFCDPFMDDIGIYSNLVAEHKRHVALILEVLRDHGIVASEKKSILFADHIEFLGHVISSKGIEPSSENLGKISSWPTPRSASDIK